MDCSKIEHWLGEYLESSLPAEEAESVAKHLETCSNCSTLLAEMRSALLLCGSYPTLEMDPGFIEKILLRTSGRPRTRSFQERFNQYLVRPFLTPRFAVGTSLVVLFLILMTNIMASHLSGAVSALAPEELLRYMDHGVQNLYGQVLKANAAKDDWQAQFGRFKNNTWNKMRSILEQMDTPVEGRKKSQDEQKEKAPNEKSSGLMGLSA
jgi:hypothetical protein